MNLSFRSVGLDRLFGATLVIVGTSVMLSTGVLEGRPARYIHVRWQSDVSPGMRTGLEERFSLAQPHQVEGQTFGYDLLNESRWNIRSLVRHPAVADTHSIDRRRFAVASTAEEGHSGRRTGLAWRWGFESMVPYARPVGFMLALLGALVLPISRRHVGRTVARFRASPAMAAIRLAVPYVGRMRRHAPPAVAAVLVVAGARLLSMWGAAAASPDVWFPPIEALPWPPIQRVVTSALLAIGAIVTVRAVVRQSGAPWLTLCLVLVAIAAFPAAASPAGFALYAAVLWASIRHVTRPGPEGFWPLTLLTVVVGGLRIEHGFHVALGTLAAVCVRHAGQGADAMRRATLGYVGSLALVALFFVPLGQLPASLGRLLDQITEVAAAQSAGQAPAVRQADESNTVEATYNIRWAPDIDAADRTAKEREYRLVGSADPDDPEGRTWQYRWDGRSSLDVRRMLADAAVEDTHRLDRVSGQFVGSDSDAAGGFLGLGALYSGVSAIATGAAGQAPRWLWLLLPIAATIQLAYRAIRRPTHEQLSSTDLLVVPALALSVPFGRLALQAPEGLVSAAAPAVPALLAVAAWLFTGGVRWPRHVAAPPTTRWRPGPR
jgi:hypothetical protein